MKYIKTINEDFGISTLELIVGFFLLQHLKDIPLKNWPQHFTENIKEMLVDFVGFCSQYGYNVDTDILKVKLDELLKKAFGRLYSEELKNNNQTIENI